MPTLTASSNTQLKTQVIAQIPRLRAFALSLSGNRDRADDLVQETIAKAWGHLGSFAEGSNLGAWLFAILRNSYFSEFRKRRREVQDSDGYFAGGLSIAPDQNAHMDLLDFRSALARLPDEQREALIMIGAAGLSYEQVAEICHCAVGTIKSRVNRGRARLAELLFVQSGAEFCKTIEWQSLQAASSSQAA